jgi:hypothetical protein
MEQSRRKSRDRLQRQGVEDVKGKTRPGDQPPKPRRSLSKVELREQAEAAFLAWRAGHAPKDTAKSEPKTIGDKANRHPIGGFAG